MTTSADSYATVVTATDSLRPVIATMLHTIERLDRRVPPVPERPPATHQSTTTDTVPTGILGSHAMLLPGRPLLLVAEPAAPP